jgi:hypothetical protein
MSIMAASAKEILQAGTSILMDILEKHHFVCSQTQTGQSSGGAFATGLFIRGNRRLELHFRYSLGMVSYHLGDRSISHEAYMWSVIGKRHASHYPGFSDDPLDGFHHLHTDLEKYGGDFLHGSDAAFSQHFDRVAELIEKQGKMPS